MDAGFKALIFAIPFVIVFASSLGLSAELALGFLLLVYFGYLIWKEAS